MNLFDFLIWKKLIEKVDSPLSGEVRIFKVLGKPRMVIGGLEQSGEYIGGIWKKGLRKLSKLSNLPITNCLILGLGGGTAARLVSQFWPGAKIVGVEIDPVVIELGRKYFRLGELGNLKIVNDDAAEWVKRKGKFDLVLVDVYLGDQVPSSCETKAFLIRTRNLLVSQGWVIFNRLFYQEKKQETEIFIKRVSQVFSRLSLVRTSSNLLTFAQK